MFQNDEDKSRKILMTMLYYPYLFLLAEYLFAAIPF